MSFEELFSYLIAFQRNYPRIAQTVICKAIQMMRFSSLLISFGNLIHRVPMETGNLLKDFNHAIKLFKHRSFISFSWIKQFPKILLKAYHLAPSFSRKVIISVLHYFTFQGSEGHHTFYLPGKENLVTKIKLNYSQALRKKKKKKAYFKVTLPQ